MSMTHMTFVSQSFPSISEGSDMRNLHVHMKGMVVSESCFEEVVGLILRHIYHLA